MNAKREQKRQDTARKPSPGPGATQRIEREPDSRREFAFGTHPWRR